MYKKNNGGQEQPLSNGIYNRSSHFQVAKFFSKYKAHFCGLNLVVIILLPVVVVLYISIIVVAVVVVVDNCHSYEAFCLESNSCSS